MKKIVDDKSFAIIACVNNEDLWEECQSYIDSLVIPKGYKVEKIRITGATSIAHAYNDAILKSAAKYKIYLHQDTFILNKNLLFDLLDYFSAPEIGMIGVMGGARIPKSGVWFHDGLHSYGVIMRVGIAEGIFRKILPAKLNKRKVRKMSFLPVLVRYIPVACIDGLFMATQYDIPWREDLFGGFIYYEGPICLEFIKNGYQVIIPRQKEPWTLHVGADRTPEEDRKYHEEFRKNMGIFRQEYQWALGKTVSQITAASHDINPTPKDSLPGR